MSDELYPNYKDIDEFVTCMFDYAKVTDPFDCDMPQHECAVQSILQASRQDEEIELLTAEVTRMDKRTRHLLDRIEDAEAALLSHDPAYQDDYWKRYPESERGKFTASGRPTPLEPEDCLYCNQGMREPICGKTHGVGDGAVGFACTRSPDHDGDHVACGVHHNVSSWPNADDSSQETDPKAIELFTWSEKIADKMLRRIDDSWPHGQLDVCAERAIRKLLEHCRALESKYTDFCKELTSADSRRERDDG